MKKYFMIAVAASMIFCLAGCGASKNQFKGVSTPEDTKALLEKVVQANNYDEIFKEYGSVDCVETQIANNNTKVYTYRSKNVMFIHGDDMTEGFQYETLDRSVVLDLNNLKCPWHSCPLDEATFAEAQKNYLACFADITFPRNYDEYEVSIVDDNTLVLEKDNDVYSYTCNPATLLVMNSSYRFADQEELYMTNEYTYNQVDNDKEHTSWVDGYVKAVSGGQTVHVKVNGVDGKVYESDFPKGFVARIYTPGADLYKHIDSDEYYNEYGEVLTEDVELDAVTE